MISDADRANRANASAPATALPAAADSELVRSVRAEFEWGWQCYKLLGWGSDETLPLTRLGYRFLSSHGLGLTKVEALEMLWFLGDKADAILEIRNWLGEELASRIDRSANVSAAVVSAAIADKSLSLVAVSIGERRMIVPADGRKCRHDCMIVVVPHYVSCHIICRATSQVSVRVAGSLVSAYALTGEETFLQKVTSLCLGPLPALPVQRTHTRAQTNARAHTHTQTHKIYYKSTEILRTTDAFDIAI